MKYVVVKHTFIRAYNSKKEAEEHAKGSSSISQLVRERAYFTVEEVEE